MLCYVGNAKKDSSQLNHSTQFVLLSIFLFLFLSSCLCIPPDFLFCCISFPQRPILIVDCLNAIYMVLFCHSFSFFPLEFRQRYTFLDAELVLMWSHIYSKVEKVKKQNKEIKRRRYIHNLLFTASVILWRSCTIEVNHEINQLNCPWIISN